MGKRITGRLLAAVALLFVAACTSTPQASRERDADAKRFDSQPGSATIYVYRPDFADEEMSSSHSVLWIGGRLIGSTLPRSYFRVDVRPGRHLLRGDGPDLGRLTLDTTAGDVYFVSLNVHGGNSHFERVTPETGKQAMLRCCALLENWAPGQRPLLR